MRLGAIVDPQLRRELQPVDDWLRQLSTQQARVVTMPQGTPTIVTNPEFDTGAFLYLPGRSFEQQSHGPVSFEALPLPYGVGTVPTVETAVSLRATTSDGGPQPARVFFFIQGGRTGATLGAQKRYWAFPSFTEVNQGPTVGAHIFVDQNDYQTLSKKTFDNGCYYQMEDTTAGSGWLNAAHNRTLQFAWGGSYVLGGAAAVTPSTTTGIMPSLQIPALDVKDNGSGVVDRSHVWPIVKRAHSFSSGSGAPFEPGGTIFGSSTGRELYPMFTTAQGTLPAPTNGSFPVWHPTVTQSCTFTLASPTVTMASTAGIAVGMRMKEVITNYALTEDTHVKSVDSPTAITMSQNWPTSNLVRTVDFFGMTWSDTATGMSGSFADNAFFVTGSADATKRIRFEVDGLTTATTRVITAPDWDGTLILSQGSSTLGQTIGVNPASHTGGTASDLAIEGHLLLGQGHATDAFSTFGLDLSVIGTDTSARFLSAPTASNFTSFTNTTSLGNIASALSGTFRLQTNSITGTPSSTSGTLSGLSALFNTINVGVPTGTSITLVTAGDFQTAVGNVDGTVTSLYGNRVIMLGPTGGGGTVATMGGMLLQTNQRAGAVTGTLTAMAFSQATGSPTGAVANFVGIDFQAASIISNNAATVNWTGIRIANAANPTGSKIAIEAQMPIISNRMRLAGSITVPTHWLEIDAGTTTIAPIKLTEGTLLTSPVAGAIEFSSLVSRSGDVADAGGGVGTVVTLTGGATTRDLDAGMTVGGLSVSRTIATITSTTTFTLSGNVNAGTGFTLSFSGNYTSLYTATLEGAFRKGFVLDDGSPLYPGRIPIAGAQGRLTDDADISFAVDTLTVTKIAATTLTGDATFADGINIVVNGTTGTKIATATTQKLGFWNTAPIIQPTTAVGAATRVGGGGAAVTDTDTFDGYTIAQVVKALRNIGLLA